MDPLSLFPDYRMSVWHQHTVLDAGGHVAQAQPIVLSDLSERSTGYTEIDSEGGGETKRERAEREKPDDIT